MPNLINVIARDFKLSKEQFDILVNCYRNKNLFEIKFPFPLECFYYFSLLIIGKFDWNTNR